MTVSTLLQHETLGKADHYGTYAVLHRLAGKSDMARPVRLHATFNAFCVGYDPTDKVVFVIDTTNSVLRICTDYVANVLAATPTTPTLSNSKTLPTNVTASTVQLIVRFGNYIWVVAQDSVSTLWGVYRASPAAGNTAYTWSGQLLTFTAGSSSGVLTQLFAGSGYLMASEYGDPLVTAVPTPHIWRISLADANGAGTNWTASYTGAGGAIRHIHTVKEDPYNPGQWIATLGDGVGYNSIQRSLDNGATWNQLVSSGPAVQAVDIDFSPTDYWFACDMNIGSVFTYDRATLTFGWAARGWHHEIACPNAGWRKGGYVFADLATNSNTTITSATAGFTSRDVGRRLGGTNIPPETYISAFTNSTTVTISQAATGTGTGGTLILSSERFYSNAYFGALDPTTGIWYQATTTGSAWGNTHGLFAVPYKGGDVRNIFTPGEAATAQYAGMGRVIVAEGIVFWHLYARAAASLAGIGA